MKIAVCYIKFGQTYYLVIDRGQIMFKWDLLGVNQAGNQIKELKCSAIC